jgi:hypothetical protein
MEEERERKLRRANNFQILMAFWMIIHIFCSSPTKAPALAIRIKCYSSPGGPGGGSGIVRIVTVSEMEPDDTPTVTKPS